MTDEKAPYERNELAQRISDVLLDALADGHAPQDIGHAMAEAMRISFAKPPSRASNSRLWAATDRH